jgi:succinate---hydroxymethylglutarate CoA-transferase
MRPCHRGILDWYTQVLQVCTFEMCLMTGYGQTGPYALRAGYDVMVEAEMGLMHITGEHDGPPVKVGVAITDLSTGLYTCNSILAALLYRHKTGRGQHIDACLSDVQVASLANIASSALIDSSSSPGRWGTAHASIVPYQGLRTKDGMIIIGAGNDRQFEILCNCIGRPELLNESKFRDNSSRLENRQELIDLLEMEFEKESTGYWLDVFEGKGMPYAAVKYIPVFESALMDSDVQATLQHSQIKAREIVKPIRHTTCGNIRVVGPPVKFSSSPPSIRSPPPVPHLDPSTKSRSWGNILQRY